MERKLYYISNRDDETPFDDLKYYEIALNDQNYNLKEAHSTVIMKEIQLSMGADKRDTIFFIHGFNTTEDDAIKTGIDIFHKYSKTQSNLVIFDWISAGSSFEYLKDRGLAELSGAILARVFEKYFDFITDKKNKEDYCHQKIHLMAHSMGNYVLSNALKCFRRTPGLFEFIGNAFLIAADVEWDCFEPCSYETLCLLSQMSEKIIIYYNEFDQALLGSEKVKHDGIKRLGRNGVKNITTVSDDIHQIKVNTQDPEVGGGHLHSYFLQSDKIISDINHWINKTPNTERVFNNKMNSWYIPLKETN